jgi:SAM-dependent methyltransferase
MRTLVITAHCLGGRTGLVPFRSARATATPSAAPPCEDQQVGHPDARSQWNANADAWTAMARAGSDVCRDLVNTPTFFATLPAVDGHRCLDLGCGEGHNTRLLADRGAQVIGLDHAETFVRHAAGVAPGGIPYLVGDGSVLPFASGAFDAVTAFMSLMDVGAPEATLAEIARVLRPGGIVQFSVTHPMTSTATRSWVDDADGTRRALAIGGYFSEGPQTETWTFGASPPELREQFDPFTITYARRTLAGWVDAVLAAGLQIEALAEPHASEEEAEAHPEVADTRIVPYFLLIRARRP